MTELMNEWREFRKSEVYISGRTTDGRTYNRTDFGMFMDFLTH